MNVSEEDDMFGSDDELNLANVLQASQSQNVNQGYMDQNAEIVDELDFRQGLARFQESQQVTANKRSTINPRTGEPVAIQSQIDEILFDLGIERHVNENDTEFYAIREGLNHAQMVSAIDEKFQDDPEKLEAFVDVLIKAFSDDDGGRFSLFSSGTVSCEGEEDTLLRALVLARTTQEVAFNLIIQKLDEFAKEDGHIRGARANRPAEAEQLKESALLCIDHLRQIYLIANCRSLLDAVFACEFGAWCSDIRAQFIEVIPELFPDITVQQECLVNLADLLLDGFQNDSLETPLALVKAMSMMNSSNVVRQRLRERLFEKVSSMEPEVIYEIVSLTIQWSRADTSRGAMVCILNQIRENVSFEKIIGVGADESEIRLPCVSLASRCILTIVQLINMKGAADIQSVAKYLQQSVAVEGTQDDELECENAVLKEFNIFDTMLALGMLNVENQTPIPKAILQCLKSQITTHLESFQDTLTTLLKLKEFSQPFMLGILHFANSMISLRDPELASIGAVAYEHLFISLAEGDARKVVLEKIFAHISYDEIAATAAVEALSNIMKTDGSTLLMFLPILLTVKEHFDCLNISNVRRMLQILVKVAFLTERYLEDYKNEVNPIIDDFLASENSRKKLWGVLGLWAHLELYLYKDTEMSDAEREKGIYERLKLAQARTDQCPGLKAEFYRSFANALRQNKNVVKSKYLFEWIKCVDAQMHRFRVPGEEANTFVWRVDHKSAEAIVTIELMTELLFYKKRCFPQTEAVLNQMKFVIDTDFHFTSDVENLSDEEKHKHCDFLFVTIELLRVILNMFTPFVKVTEDRDFAMLVQKRFELMCKCQEELRERIQKLGSYRLPSHTWTVELAEMVVVMKSKEELDKGKARRTKKPERARTNEGDDVNEEPASEMSSIGRAPRTQFVVPESSNDVAVEQLHQYFRPLNLSTTMDLLEMMPLRSKTTMYQLELLRKTFNLVVPLKRRISHLPWTTKLKLPGERFLPVHDKNELWHSISCHVKTILHVLKDAQRSVSENLKAPRLFAEDGDESLSDFREHELMPKIVSQCLEILYDILTRNDVTMLTNFKGDSGVEGLRQVLIEQIAQNTDEATSELDFPCATDEQKVVRFFLWRAQELPNIDAACVLLKILALFPGVPSSSVAKAQCAWNLMNKAWTDSENMTLKGAGFNKQIASILKHCLKFRSEEVRLHAMFAFISKYLPDIIPQAERENYLKLRPVDDDAEDVVFDQVSSEEYACPNIHKSTFASIFKTLFEVLTEAVSPKSMKTLSTSESLAQWRIASRCFYALSLFIRIKSLRSVYMVADAARGGRKFLDAISHSPGGFIALFNTPSKIANSSVDILNIIKNVQQGNRALQCIGVDAKQERNLSLLKLTPALRTSHEVFLQRMKRAFSDAGCAEAFSVGLLKSRTMDGEEVVSDRPSSSLSVGREANPQEMGDPFGSDEYETEEAITH